MKQEAEFDTEIKELANQTVVDLTKMFFIEHPFHQTVYCITE